MAFGAEIRNSTNNLVVDMTYQNLSLAKKQTFSLSAGQQTTVTLTGAVAPMMAIRADNYVGLQGMAVSGSTFSWVCKAGSAAASGAFYVFDKPHSAHTSSFGMAVYDGSGVEMFNSDNNYLRMVDLLAVPYSAYYDSGAYFYCTTGAVASNTSLPSSTYAVCMSQSRLLVQLIDTSNYTYRCTFDGVKTTSTAAYVSQSCSVDFVAGSSNYFPGTFAFSGSGTQPAMIIDVTGF